MAGLKGDVSSNQGIAAIKPQTTDVGSVDTSGLSAIAAPTPLKASYTPTAPVATPSTVDDFMARYAQNVGGQFADPYQNYLMTHGADSNIPSLLQQYQASGNTNTPDWAALAKNMNQLPQLASTWDASGANPVPYLQAWNRTTPTTNVAPQGYWDSLLAYNTGASQFNPKLAASRGYYANNFNPLMNSPAMWNQPALNASRMATGGKVLDEAKQQQLQRSLQRIGK